MYIGYIHMYIYIRIYKIMNRWQSIKFTLAWFTKLVHKYGVIQSNELNLYLYTKFISENHVFGDCLWLIIIKYRIVDYNEYVQKTVTYNVTFHTGYKSLSSVIVSS